MPPRPARRSIEATDLGVICMRLLAWLTTALATTGLVLASGAASTPSAYLDPPVLLQPPAGKAFKAKTQISFTIRSHAGDEYLWLYVSRSPKVVKACGTIAHEVSIWDFVPTSDPTVYIAKPNYYSYDSFWMNTPGTYYWQAYRIEHGGGADGCIESEIRPFVITAAGSTTPPPPTPTTPTTPKAKRAAPLSNARLAGEFDVTTRVTSASGIDSHRGETDSFTWAFMPTCSAGACTTRLRFDYSGASLDSHTARLVLKKAGKVYKGSTMTPIVECNLADVPVKLNVTLEVTKGAWMNGKWRATKVAGRYEWYAPQTTSGGTTCRAASITAIVRGTLES